MKHHRPAASGRRHARGADRPLRHRLEQAGFAAEECTLLEQAAAELPHVHVHRLHSRLRRLSALQAEASAPSPSACADLRGEMLATAAQGREVLAARLAPALQLAYPEELPVCDRREDITAALRSRQVVIVSGETGSGKTTQLPKMCLEAGLGVRGLIGHTQPRRLAARTVAARLAAELGQELGVSVGYKVRFSDCVSAACRIKLMTDGMLLSELASDRLLLGYDCIIIDEAHERSLNIDFLLGYLTELLPRRPDLRVIITSATIDLERFAAHFDRAPVFEVAGRTYPVEVAYMPLVAQRDAAGESVVAEMTLGEGILEALQLLLGTERGDVLVFLPGEREITLTLNFLRRHQLRDVEVLPLYARLAYAEQERIFRPHRGVRVILATNVAETSITVPGIRYVIDTGLVRISRYSPRTRLRQLCLEAVSRASADQRLGRCGRLGPGICVRLYSEEDYLARPRYTDPELRRSSLAAVILQMLHLRLGDIARFPFIDPPDARQIRDGLRELHELGAIRTAAGDGGGRPELTQLGREMARLPVDPRLGRMIAAAARRGCLTEMLVLCAALTVSDPRESPPEQRAAAAQAHARFRSERSDFMAILSLHAYLQEAQRTLSRRQFAAELRRGFISWLRTKEWFDLHLQLRLMCRSLGYAFNEQPADYQSLHQSLLPGMLSNLGALNAQDGDYTGANGIHFSIAPGSGLFRRHPKFIMAAEIARTSRVYARHVAAIEPAWVAECAGHLLHRTYGDVHFSAARGAAMAYMSATLYGLPIITRQRCDYHRIDPVLARELFIREGLVGGAVRSRHPFLRRNRALTGEIEELERRVRSRNLLAGEQALYDFYDRRIPREVTCLADFEAWYADAAAGQADLLDFALEDVATARLQDIDRAGYPDELCADGLRLKLSYVFDPASPRDGVSVHIPLAVLGQVSTDPFAYPIVHDNPELHEALIRSLPKRLRRSLIPAPEYARALRERLAGRSGPFLELAARSLSHIGGVQITPGDFDLSQIPQHLFLNYVIEDAQGRELACGRELAELAAGLSGQLSAELGRAAAAARPQAAHEHYTAWTFGDLQRRQDARQGGHRIIMYPALADRGDGVAIEYCDSERRQQATMKDGLRRLILLNVGAPLSYLQEHLPNRAKLAMYCQGPGGVGALIEELCLTCIDELVARHGGPPARRAEFEALTARVRGELCELVLQAALTAEQALLRAHELRRMLAGRLSPGQTAAAQDSRRNLEALLAPGRLAATAYARLGELGRYVQAMTERLPRAALDPVRDQTCQRRLDAVGAAYEDAVQRYRGCPPPQLQEVWWGMQELRVSYFAQKLGVRQAVSDKRLQLQLQRLLGEYPP